MHSRANTDKIITRVLRLGSITSILLMTAGLLMFLVKGGSPLDVNYNPGFVETISGAIKLEPVALMSLGIVVLLLTPFLRVLGAMISFLVIDKDIKYTLISLFVLAVLVTSLFLPGIL